VDPSDCRWETRISVEAFADLAQKHRIFVAAEVSKLFAKAVSQGTCGEKRELLEILSRALPLERAVIERIPSAANREARRKFASSLEKLGRAIEERDVESSLRAQGRIAEAAGDL